MCLYVGYTSHVIHVFNDPHLRKDRRGPDTSADFRSTNAEAVTASTDVLYTHKTS